MHWIDWMDLCAQFEKDLTNLKNREESQDERWVNDGENDFY